MIVQYALQKLRASVIGETEILYLPLGLLLKTPLKTVIALVGIIVVAVFYGMKEIL